MKKLLCILPLVILCGCEYGNTPMQAVINQYKTDEVKLVDPRNNGFVVRDTNGAIWHVETKSSNKGYNTNGYYEYITIRNTLLFEGIKKVDKIKLEE